MNKSYKSVWNEALGAWVAVSEIESARGKKSHKAVRSVLGLSTPEDTGGGRKWMLLSAMVVALSAVLPLTVQAQPVVKCEIGTGASSLLCDPDRTNGGTTSASGASAIAIGKAANAAGDSAVATNQAIAAGQTHYYSVNDGGVPQGNYNNDGASGVNSVAAGVNAMASGGTAVAIGDGASANTNGSLALGRGAETQLAFPSNPSSVGNGEKSVAIGFGAITAATSSTAIGYGAKTYAIDNLQPHSSVAIGTSSLAGGVGSTTVGSQSGMDTHSHVNLALGWKVGNTIYGTGTNVAIGSNGTGSNLFADTTNVRNQVAGESVAIGMNAGSNVNAAPTGYSHYMPGPGHSIFIGNGAGSPSTGDVNVFVGQLAGRSTVGSSNVGLGLFSGWFVKGDRNVGVGEFAGEGAIGNNNSSYGFNAGSHLTGDGNIAIGENSARNTTGNYNTAIGKGAGANTIGSDNLALGSGANMAAGTAPLTVDRAVALGQKAMAVGNDSIALGTMSVAGTTSGRHWQGRAGAGQPVDQHWHG